MDDYLSHFKTFTCPVLIFPVIENFYWVDEYWPINRRFLAFKSIDYTFSYSVYCLYVGSFFPIELSTIVQPNNFLLLLFLVSSSTPHAGFSNCTFPISPYRLEIYISRPYNHVTENIPKSKQATPERSKWILNILGKSREHFPVRSSTNIVRFQYTRCQIVVKEYKLEITICAPP